MSRSSGFTLIEMLVALAVFGLAALALVRLEGATLRSAAMVETRQLAAVVANNLAVTVLSDPRAPAIGVRTGSVTNGGRSWSWSQRVSRTADPAIVRIDLTVADMAGKPAAALTLARPVE